MQLPSASIGVAVAAALALAATAWQQRCKSRTGADHPCRAPIPRGGKMVELAHGTCHYILDGAENSGPLVVLVHGFMRNSSCLSVLAHELVRRDRRVLRWDLGGRGLSDYGNDLPHTPALFAGQLAELLMALGERGRIDLAGYSMGAPIAAKFAAAFPSRIHSLVLLCPAGTSAGPYLPPWLPAVFSLPALPLVLARCLLSSMRFADEWETPSGADWVYICVCVCMWELWWT